MPILRSWPRSILDSNLTVRIVNSKLARSRLISTPMGLTRFCHFYCNAPSPCNDWSSLTHCSPTSIHNTGVFLICGLVSYRKRPCWAVTVQFNNSTSMRQPNRRPLVAGRRSCSLVYRDCGISGLASTTSCFCCRCCSLRCLFTDRAVGCLQRAFAREVLRSSRSSRHLPSHTQSL